METRFETILQPGSVDQNQIYMIFGRQNIEVFYGWHDTQMCEILVRLPIDYNRIKEIYSLNMWRSIQINKDMFVLTRIWFELGVKVDCLTNWKSVWLSITVGHEIT